LLDKNNLKNQLLNALSPPYPNSAEEAANRIANAYHTYAQAAQDPMNGIPTNLSAKLPGLISELSNIFSDLVQPVSVKVNQLATAFSNYWMGVIFIISAPPGGQSTVTSITGTAQLINELTVILTDLDPEKTTDDKMNELSTALDNFTKTVMVTGQMNTAPSPTPYAGPIF